ncbi:MAG: DUF4124 domain-containing protein [Steroidobacter sp.]
MRILFFGMMIAGALFTLSPAYAQIYACVGEDGTRIFSDERCGADAKIVPGISTKRRPAASPTTPKAPRAIKPQAELEALSKQCDAGDMKACKEWTLGGGPNLLRKNERQAELDCEAGSLAACEIRYCRDGVSADCRARVLRTAKLAGESWYLREAEHGHADGLTRYHIRCVPEDAPSARDITILCSSLAGPNRCYVADPQQGFARLDRAAAKHCAI